MTFSNFCIDDQWNVWSQICVLSKQIAAKKSDGGRWVDNMKHAKRDRFIRTNLLKTQSLSFHSAGRHCHNCWLLLSKQVQCLRNSSRQLLFISSILFRLLLALTLLNDNEDKSLGFAPSSKTLCSAQCYSPVMQLSPQVNSYSHIITQSLYTL
jgi:hypothetical protein